MTPIGGLDERFGLGFFDDDDLAERARRAGFELAVAHDLFVHHFGSRTFVGNGIDAEAPAARRTRGGSPTSGATTGPAAGGSRLRPWVGIPDFAQRSQRHGRKVAKTNGESGHRRIDPGRDLRALAVHPPRLREQRRPRRPGSA